MLRMANSIELDHRRIKQRVRVFELLRGDLQGAGADLSLIEVASVAQQRAVAFGADGLDDRLHSLDETGEVAFRAFQKRRPGGGAQSREVVEAANLGQRYDLLNQRREPVAVRLRVRHRHGPLPHGSR